DGEPDGRLSRAGAPGRLGGEPVRTRAPDPPLRLHGGLGHGGRRARVAGERHHQPAPRTGRLLDPGLPPARASRIGEGAEVRGEPAVASAVGGASFAGNVGGRRRAGTSEKPTTGETASWRSERNWNGTWR